MNCKAKSNGEVLARGKRSIEWYNDGKPQYYCYGHVDTITGELIETCTKCMKNIEYAKEDLELAKIEKFFITIGKMRNKDVQDNNSIEK